MTTTPIADKGVFTPEDLAKRYDTSTAALATLRHKGKGPRFFKMGRRVYYRLDDVLAYEEAAMQERTA
ncbi:hypothetical protein BI49514_03240 [Brevibacterium iodinum ATCC 49514]|uniref:Helix-turn-helix domain-containing protein n=2 Tax=Brevibacterium TaxID=1696 RepID=A0A2H1J4D0_BRELN|nr:MULTISPECIES: helix-turn-helix domain-containing protein [Brevibacterium]KAB1947456.1 DNA-binding protein [Brevibacterium linens ATCC 9172]SMX82072.1 hypothetical protein BLIN9172_01728 [Brevibacterium linens ATCC 9172]SMY02012.1 hypothetical protein BI49514_03240 [Brevibacterium iodinum ATCC 49514]